MRTLLFLTLFYSNWVGAQEAMQPQKLPSQAEQQQGVLVEKFNLEEQTIQLKGKTYVLAKNVVILNSNNVSLGLKGLKLGQIVEFKILEEKNAANYREDLTLPIIGQIKIISSSTKPDELH